MRLTPTGRGKGLRLSSFRPRRVSWPLVLGLGLLTLIILPYAASALRAPRPPANFVNVTTWPQLREAINESSSRPVLLVVAETTCYYCHVLYPYAMEYARGHPGILLAWVLIDRLYDNNATAAEELAAELDLQGTPTEAVIYNRTLYGYHVGSFAYPGVNEVPMIEQFVNASLARAGLKLEENTSGAAAKPIVAPSSRPALGPARLGALALAGFMGAVSPCSLPMLTIYAAMGDRRRASRSLATNVAIVVAAVALGGLALVEAYFHVPELYEYIIAFASGVTLGLAVEVGRGKVIAVPRGATAIAPVLGLECSLPFFVAALGLLASGTLLLALEGVLAFSLGYAVPYVVAATALGAALERLASNRTYALVQAALLAAASAYLAYLVFVVA